MLSDPVVDESSTALHLLVDGGFCGRKPIRFCSAREGLCDSDSTSKTII